MYEYPNQHRFSLHDVLDLNSDLIDTVAPTTPTSYSVYDSPCSATATDSHCLRVSSIDNSDYMRNGDFVPSRIQAQQDAVGMVCHAKTRANPENNCGLITSAG